MKMARILFPSSCHDPNWTKTKQNVKHGHVDSWIYFINIHYSFCRDVWGIAHLHRFPDPTPHYAHTRVRTEAVGLRAVGPIRCQTYHNVVSWVAGVHYSIWLMRHQNGATRISYSANIPAEAIISTNKYYFDSCLNLSRKPKRTSTL